MAVVRIVGKQKVGSTGLDSPPAFVTSLPRSLRCRRSRRVYVWEDGSRVGPQQAPFSVLNQTLRWGDVQVGPTY